MKVLWVTKVPFNYHYQMMGVKTQTIQSGSWLTAAFEDIKRCSDIELHIVTVANVKDRLTKEYENVHFHILPNFGDSSYNIDSTKVKQTWKELRQVIAPDCLQLWGTEYSISLAAARAFKGIPILVYMQGLISVVKQHYYDGVPFKYITMTPRDVYAKRVYSKKCKVEKEIMSLATGAIVENDWCIDQCKALNSNIKIFKNFLPIKKIFYDVDWNITNVNRHVIMTNAGGYPIKGHHILFKALAIVKQKYPDVVVNVPGVPLTKEFNLRCVTGFNIYLKRLIDQYNLSSNINFVGVVPDHQMVEMLRTCNVYVMPSIVENHSCSLIEAMIAGAPCITSLVGGIAGMVSHMNNAILYNSLDAESLAGNIIRIFENDELAISLGREAKQMGYSRPQNFGEEIISIYKSL